MRRVRTLAAWSLAGVLAAQVLSGCSGSRADEGTAARPSAPLAASPTSTPSPSPSASPVSQLERLGREVEALHRGVVFREPRIAVRRKPAGSQVVRHIADHNPMRQTLVFLATDVVRRDAQTWFRILLPRRPNGLQGWVQEDDVRVVKLDERIEIDLSEFTLTRFRGDRRVARYEVGVGEPQWPTPTGTYYVWAHVPQSNPAGPYGTYALGLSGFSPVLTDWPGGGRFAIHGTPRRWDTGRRVSHGCIRVFNPDVKRLRNVPMGTPVVITR